MIRFLCKECGFSRKVPDEAAGRKVRCPECQSLALVMGRTPTVIVYQDGVDEPPARTNDSDSEPESYELAPKPSLGLTGALAIVGLVVWGLVTFAMCSGSLVFLGAMREAKSAPQEAAIGAVFSTIFIALYVLARCIEKIIDAVERLRPK
jgi:DNA-directed RNA polymerase subunit RPC12/RpoP